MPTRSATLNPSKLFRFFWSFLVLAGALWYAVLVPLQFSLDLDPQGTLAGIDFFWTVFFLLDLVLNFHWAYYEDGELVRDVRKVRIYYLRHGFRVDFLASLPLDWIALILFGAQPEMLLWYRCLRLLKLLRLVRLPRLVANLNAHGRGLITTDLVLSANTGSRLLLLSLWGIIGVNIISCLWIEVQPPPPDQSITETYIKAFYWAVTTLATVGYGDITPSTNLGRLFASMVMIVGVGVYGLWPSATSPP
ncbi:MAG: ion transporter [Magnetococcales bacterium]|nr:ion transporter [Magnetococcales bacterium]